MTETYDLLVSFNGEGSFDLFAKAFFAAVGADACSERESVHYVEERYFKGKSGGIVFKVMLADDEDHADLPFWVDIEIVDPAGNIFRIDEFVEERCQRRRTVSETLFHRFPQEPRFAER